MVVLSIAALIFGGCCSNVYTLEAILKHEPNSGLLITFTQFIFVTLLAYPSQASQLPPFFLKKPKIPWQALLTSAGMFCAVNILNNWAFAFNISVPVHIILRSFGVVTTMLAGMATGKRYSVVQSTSVLILTVGVVTAAFADAESRHQDLTSETEYRGLLLLLLAQILASVMGIYVQDMYAEYGKHWTENMLYSHLLSIPFVLPLHKTLRSQYQHLALSPPLSAAALPYLWLVPIGLEKMATRAVSAIPSSVAYLLLNGATQCLCIMGVNMLNSRCSAVTVTMVLNVRKLLSFLFSVWLFGNAMSPNMAAGAAVAFVAAGLYGWESARISREHTLALAPRPIGPISLVEDDLGDPSLKSHFYKGTSFDRKYGNKNLPSPEAIKAKVRERNRQSRFPIPAYSGQANGGMVFEELGVFVKYGTPDSVTAYEAINLRVINRTFRKSEIPCPEVYGWTIDYSEKVTRKEYATYIYMEYANGLPLEEMWGSMQAEARLALCAQLKEICDRLRLVQQRPESLGYIGPVHGGPIRDYTLLEGMCIDGPPGPFTNLESFYKWVARQTDFVNPESTEGSEQAIRYLHALGEDVRIKLTHGDIQTFNIIVDRNDPGKMVALVDWDTLWWAPEYWEYFRAWKHRQGREFNEEWVPKFLTPYPKARKELFWVIYTISPI